MVWVVLFGLSLNSFRTVEIQSLKFKKEIETRDTNLKIVTREMVFKAMELQLHRE